MRIVVLGAGMVGRLVARELAQAFPVTVLDARAQRLDPRRLGGARGVVADLDGPEALERAVAPHDLVVDALPGHRGWAALEAAVEAGKHVVDIAFMPEDPLALAPRAAARGVTALVDLGVAPGMGNAILGHHLATMRRVDRFECLVGGLPVQRHWPFEYKAPFSPADVIEEYVRPAHLREAGTVVTRPALSEPERVEFEGVGTLEALLTDGLRTLLATTRVPWMKEKTLRYPGAGRLLEALRTMGLFDEQPVEAGGVSVRPRDLAAALLFPRWALAEGEPELTAMRVTVEGLDADGRGVRHVWELLDRGDPERGDTSMARTTAFPCAAGVHLLASGRWRRPGVWAPEQLAADGEAFAFLLAHQAERGVRYRHAATPREAD